MMKTSKLVLQAVVLVAVVLRLGGEARSDQNDAPAKSATAKPTFENVGPQVGDQLPDLNLRNLKGEPQRLGDAWRNGPALVVTSSFTCPKSRSRWPELKAIVNKYDEKLNVVIVYVIEAHPVGSICPYKGVEEVTPENQRDGILRQQPATIEDRFQLAEEFKRYLRVNTPIYVDTIDNKAWKAFGAAPNIAFLVGEQGVVKARQGWFEGSAMRKAIDTQLVESAPRQQSEIDREEELLAEKHEAIEKKLHDAGFQDGRSDVRDAIRNKDTRKLKELLDRVPDAVSLIFPAEQGHNHETTVLMEAIEDGSPSAVAIVLDHGADVKARTESFASALQLAAAGQTEVVKLLLRHHADSNTPDRGHSPLHEALIAGDAEIAKILIDSHAKEDFYSDIGLGKIDSVRARLRADPSRALRPDGAGRMPLDYAAANGQLEMAMLLLKSAAPVVDYELSPIEVPIHYAIRRGDRAMLKFLLQSGSSPNTALGYRGESARSEPPLHMAIDADNLDILNLLLSHKASLKSRNTYSMTPLHYAAERGKAIFAETLIKAGADVNAQQLKYSLPCGSGEEETPQLNTPLHFAAAGGNPETIKVLLKAGAKIEARNVNGQTPLMATVERLLYSRINEDSQLKNIECLLSSGADLNAREKNGATVLDFAKAHTRDVPFPVPQNVVDLLIKHGAKSGRN